MKSPGTPVPILYNEEMTMNESAGDDRMMQMTRVSWQ